MTRQIFVDDLGKMKLGNCMKVYETVENYWRLSIEATLISHKYFFHACAERRSEVFCRKLV